MQLAEIKQRIDLHDLADRLGLVRPDPKGNYKSPHHNDKSPSLSIFNGRDGIPRWKDFSGDDGGDCFDLVKFVHQCDEATAIKTIRDWYGFRADVPDTFAPKAKSKMEYIAGMCLANPVPAITYLVEERSIDETVAKNAIDRKSLGFSNYTSPSIEVGRIGYGGDAVAFICTDKHTRAVFGIDYRYLDPKLNGDLKTKSQGEKENVIWTSCWYRLKQAHTVVIVESAINALSAETAWHKCNVKGRAALAIRGTANKNIDWGFLVGKRVIICLDNDEPIQEGPQKGKRPGPEAAWAVCDALTALNISAMMVDQGTTEWVGVNDLNDYLKAHGANAVRNALDNLEPWMVPGLPGECDDGHTITRGRPRIYLPAHDFQIYWRYRVKPDFTSLVKYANGDEGEQKLVAEDVCGFRIAAISRITIASAQATMTGGEDAQPQTVFAASVQTPRHGHTLIRRVLNDDALHNITSWNKFGPVFKPQQFSRLLTIWERATELGARKAANYVGLCFKEGRPAVNEGADCYFSDPEKQCPYHNLRFPSSAVESARNIIEAYQNTFRQNAAMQLLAWGLGGHLKAYLGFWPHMVLQADKGSGKTTLIKSLESTIAFTMFSGQSLSTEYRLVTSVSHTSHPVGWEELSARRQDVIDKAVALLQETYQHSVTRRGADMTEYLLSAPVLLAGEDVPVDSLQGKIVRSQLSGRKGDLLPENLPRFPVKEWLQFLARIDPARVRETYRKVITALKGRAAAAGGDDGAERMICNYAALGTAWLLLCEFADLPPTFGNFNEDMIREMNTHVLESRSIRDPWVWIMEIVLGEIDRDDFRFPYKFEVRDNDTLLLIRTTHIMQHLSQTGSLKAKFDSMPVKTAKVFSKQLDRAGVVKEQGIERTIRNQRVSNLTCLSLSQLASYGLSVSIPELI